MPKKSIEMLIQKQERLQLKLLFNDYYFYIYQYYNVIIIIKERNS